jgi:hypothetical protein
MSIQQQLEQMLIRMDGRNYKTYKDLRGSYEFENFTLHIDHVQGDPFAAHSRLRVEMPQEIAVYALLSITEKPDDLLMWPYYADSYAGVVLILRVNLQILTAFPEKPLPYPIQVDYAKEMPFLFITRLAMKSISGFQ